MKRTSNGTVIIKSSSEEAMYEQLGIAHATDRGLQMLLMRILGKGRAAEILEGSDKMVVIDKFFRKLNWNNCKDEIEKFDERTLLLFKAYNKGINKALKKRRPWEFLLVGYHPEKCGEIDLESVKDRSLAYTPVPGGVGPMTINTLILQTVMACEKTI